ncbi:hypothetical protein CDL12_21705 [Handroanthus impetiginosus]|uniref:Uncharacterized protein n=1 Tax=Handroanthus impetiginosus TaxID=429701 RepID=A0A2G9GKC3_9LAMI|nr:hypothetical protein CDL12_21705 [Handroanthus impetiginosus]
MLLEKLSTHLLKLNISRTLIRTSLGHMNTLMPLLLWVRSHMLRSTVTEQI